MLQPLSLLLVEDDPNDTELLLIALQQAGFEPHWKRVDTEEKYLEHLHNGLDLVLSDFGMPRFSGLRALQLLQQSRIEVPFIIVSGTIGEDTAVAAMKHGASDYLLKHSLARLGSAVNHALNQSRLRKEAKAAEIALRESEERFRQMAENMNEVFWMSEPVNNTVLYVSPAYEAIWGRKCADLYADPKVWGQAIHQEDRPRVIEAARVGQTSGKYSENYRIVRPDGSLRWIRDRAFPVRNEKGEVYRVVGTAEDITQQKKAQTRATILHEVVEVLAQAAPLPEAAQRILEIVCRGLEWDVGAMWTQDRTTNKLRCVEIWSPSAQQFSAFMDATRAMECAVGEELPGRAWRVMEPLWFADVAKEKTFNRPYQTGKDPLKGALAIPIQLRGETFGIVEFFSTISHKPGEEMLQMFAALGTQLGQFIERKRLEDQFRQAQKMEAIGTLAGGIAHDFNNVLQAITGYTELAKLDLVDNPTVRGYLDATSDGTKRAADLVQQILAFSRFREIERKSTRLGPVVLEALKLLRSTIPAKIQFDIAVEQMGPTVLADPTQIHQVVMNLATNATHAMKGVSGRLGIVLKEIELDAGAGLIHPALRPGSYMRLSLSDTGHGIDPGTASRIFEPFFTTKALGEGTGLGLAVVHGIMQSHDGAITVESQVGKGAVFHLYFPTHASDSAPIENQCATTQRGKGESILYIDDETTLALLGKQTLERLGYRVDTYTVPADAVEAMRRNPEKYDLVVTDLNMPGMNGADLTQRMLKIRLDVPVIMTTGYSASLTLSHARAIGVREIVLKPVGGDSLGEVVYRVLAEQKGRPRLAQAAGRLY